MQDTFNQKFDVGYAGEVIAKHYFENVLKHKVTHATGFDREKDLIVNGQLVEIKTDVYSAKSDRIALEHRSLETHKASHIVFLKPTFYWIPRIKAQILVETWPTKGPGGDDQREHTFIERHSQQTCPTCKRQLDSAVFSGNFKTI